MKHVTTHCNGVLTRETFFNDNGELHNENGPANTEWDDNGNMIVQEYKVNGIYHNKHGAAHTEWASNGQMIAQIFQINGEYTDGQALTFWDENGNVERTVWYLNGRAHNESGPAEIYFGKEYYYLEGELYTKEEWEQKVSERKVNLPSSPKEVVCACGRKNDAGEKHCWYCERAL